MICILVISWGGVVSCSVAVSAVLPIFIFFITLTYFSRFNDIICEVILFPIDFTHIFYRSAIVF